jgi:Ca2+-binding EF-hand superfamily protein
MQSMKEALKAHYKGKDMTVREVFDALDDDGSGYLDRTEIEKAAGILGGVLGELMSAEGVQKCFESMDPDGDGEVTFDEFAVWWKWQEAEKKAEGMDEAALAEELQARGMQLQGKASMVSMKEALKALYSGREMTARQLFNELDEDGSGYLDRAEVEKAAGLLGSSLGILMDTDQQDAAFRAMDPDGDGEVTFEEFDVWWKGVEAEQLIGDMDESDVAEALMEAGIVVSGDASQSSMQSMKEALKAHYKGKDMTPREVFDALDEDGSGFLDREEIEKASGVLGAGLGFIMSSEELDRQFRAMDPDGDGEVTFDEFSAWCKCHVLCFRRFRWPYSYCHIVITPFRAQGTTPGLTRWMKMQ